MASKSNYKYIGIDCENFFQHSIVDQIGKMIVSSSEKIFLACLDAPFIDLMTLVFSAKKSLFKAVYPHIRKYFDFHSVKISNISLDDGRFSLRLREDLRGMRTISWTHGRELMHSY